MKKIVNLFLVMFLMSTSVIAVGQGQENSQQPTTTQGNSDQKCNTVTQRVDDITGRYTQSKDRYQNAFRNIYQNVEALMNKLNANGLDTSKLQQDLNSFNTMIQNSERFYNEFMNGLENSKKYVCGQGTGSSTQELTRARQQLSLCRDEMLQLRTFAQTTLQQDLSDLKTELSQ